MADSTDTAAAYEVFARKYRPRNFDDVVGQDHVVTTLKNAIEANRVHHAYIFVGPRGTGKTSTARIFAKALSYEKGPTTGSTDDCELCREIAAGNSLDVLEIDGASNNGVEQVRELRENARFAPARARYKIYIIDEVHMLSIGAFNALLKILEEPPPHVKFFFATTEAHKVPVTILSRCQRFDLKRIPAPLIVERLRGICGLEDIDADEAALLAVARMADGGMRDAQSALDQLISFQGRVLREEHVLAVFGLVSHDRVVDLSAAVLEGDVAGIIDLVESFDQDGKDLQRVMVELMEHLRNLLLFAYTNKEGHLGELTPARRQQVAEQAAKLDPAVINRVIDQIMDSHAQLTHSLNRRVAVEMALIRSARAASLVPVDRVIRDLHALRDELGGAPAEEAAGVEPDKKKVAAEAPPAAAPDGPAPRAAAPAAPAPAAPTTPAADPDDRRRWYEHPGVQKVLEKFNGDIQDVELKPKPT